MTDERRPGLNAKTLTPETEAAVRKWSAFVEHNANDAVPRLLATLDDARESEGIEVAAHAMTRESLRMANLMARAQMAAILDAIGGEVERKPTRSTNYLQRLLELVQHEADLDAARTELELARSNCADGKCHACAACYDALVAYSANHPEDEK